MVNSEANGIVTSISQKIDEAFNQKYDKYAIYGEEIKQGLQEPCFFIKILKSSIKHVLGKRYFLSQSFDIHYFPENDLNTEKEMLEIADNLYDALEYVDWEGDLVRGTNMNYKIIDDVLHFFVDYNYYILKNQTKDACFEDLNYTQEVKDE